MGFESKTELLKKESCIKNWGKRFYTQRNEHSQNNYVPVVL